MVIVTMVISGDPTPEEAGNLLLSERKTTQVSLTQMEGGQCSQT